MTSNSNKNTINPRMMTMTMMIMMMILALCTSCSVPHSLIYMFIRLIQVKTENGKHKYDMKRPKTQYKQRNNIQNIVHYMNHATYRRIPVLEVHRKKASNSSLVKKAKYHSVS